MENQYFQNFRKTIYETVNQFIEDPLGYSISAIKDYGDMGLSIAGGYLFIHKGMETGFFMFLAGSVVGSTKSEGIDRASRNIFAGLSSMCIGGGNYIWAGITGLASLCQDRYRRDRKKNLENSLQI